MVREKKLSSQKGSNFVHNYNYVLIKAIWPGVEYANRGLVKRLDEFNSIKLSADAITQKNKWPGLRRNDLPTRRTIELIQVDDGRAGVAVDGSDSKAVFKTFKNTSVICNTEGQIFLTTTWTPYQQLKI